jgi:hypothetical protein
MEDVPAFRSAALDAILADTNSGASGGRSGTGWDSDSPYRPAVARLRQGMA